jgi:hypothetical protein
LHKDIQDFALAIDSPPQVHAATLDGDHHLVQVPPITGSRAQSAHITGDDWPKLEDPSPDRLVGDVEASLSQELFDIAVAEREAQVEPDTVPDDLGRELVTPVGNGLHAPYSIRKGPGPSAVPATKPARPLPELGMGRFPLSTLARRA